MKSNLLNRITLALSVSAISYCGWIHHQLDAQAEKAVARREAKLVAEWAPTVRLISAEVLGRDTIPPSPQRLEQLSQPMITALAAFPLPPSYLPPVPSDRRRNP